MARWQPNALERLARAAFELFAERGYEQTTVVEIAARAGLTKSTFFRHVPDKREILFIGQDLLADAFTQAIASAPSAATPLEAIEAALRAAAPAFVAGREFAPLRQAIIAANPELQEREATKALRLNQALAAALRERGVDEARASIAAGLGMLALGRAYARLADGGEDFAALASAALGELRQAAAAL